MKLATALTERSDVQRRLSELQSRLNNNAKVQEGDEPSEPPSALLAELDALLARLEELVTRINLTNSATYADGVPLTALLSRRDALKLRVSTMRSFLDCASQKTDRYARSEIKVYSTVPVAELQKQVDGYSKELREVDEKIQELNWTTELL